MEHKCKMCGIDSYVLTEIPYNRYTNAMVCDDCLEVLRQIGMVQVERNDNIDQRRIVVERNNNQRKLTETNT
jgi:hypothetical protein